MFKAPDKHRPREWGSRPMAVSVAFAAAIVAALVVLSFVPYGGEIGLALGGLAFAVIVYRQAQKPGT